MNEIKNFLPTSYGNNQPLPKNSGEKSEKEKIIAAITIQRFFRGYQARRTWKKLKNEKQPQLTKTQPHSDVQSSSFPTQSVKKIFGYGIKLKFPDGNKKYIEIDSFDDVEGVLKNIIEYFNHIHLPVKIYFDGYASKSKLKKVIATFQQSTAAESLQFSISFDSKIVIKPKLKTKDVYEDKIRYTYANGTIIIFNNTGNGRFNGTRIFPNGKKEQGEFCKGELPDSGYELESGYRINANGEIEFVNPEPLAAYEDKSRKSQFEIFEIEGELVVLEKTYPINYKITSIPLDIALFKASLYNFTGIESVLLHASFDKYRSQFIDRALSPDDSGTPWLFKFPDEAATAVVEAASKAQRFDPLKLVDPISGKNFFIHAAQHMKCLSTLVELFPQAFQTVGQDVIAALLQNGDYLPLVQMYAAQLKLDVYHNLWLQVANGIEPDENFKKEFALLTAEQKRVLYDAAFIYNNPFIHEPTNIPVKPEQYSINLMWINADKMSVKQKFLFGDGETSTQRTQDFQERFVKPVSKWVKANPGSPINIWVDREMATANAIERSRKALLEALDETSHDLIHFRDVRSMEIVNANPQVFSEETPIYFRVDLLRAIAADHTLSNQETKFFVYGDIDMEPMTGQELFDKRTVTFLDDYGCVMAKRNNLPFMGPIFENGFQILNGDNAQFIRSHRKEVINLGVYKALEYKNPQRIDQELIYKSYGGMMTHFLDAVGPGSNLKLSKRCLHGLDANPKSLGDRFILPQKPVRLPPSHFEKSD